MNRVLQADARQLPLRDESVDCCITSPPYFNARDYGVNAQIGWEQTLEQYLDNLLAVFAEVKRVMKPTATLWVVIGDSYNGSGKGGGGQTRKQVTNRGSLTGRRTPAQNHAKPKDLMMVPAQVAIALRSELGFYLRSEIPWIKPNPMIESVKDRPTRAHEMVYLLSKEAHYYYDHAAVATPVKPQSIKRHGRAVSDKHKNVKGAPGQTPHSAFQPPPNRRSEIAQASGQHSNVGLDERYTIPKQDGTGERIYARLNERYDGERYPKANMRGVFYVAPANFKGSHYAVFPEKLITPMMLAGCPAGGLALDPFAGSGTVGLVAARWNRHFIGFDLSYVFCQMANERLAPAIQTEMGL